MKVYVACFYSSAKDEITDDAYLSILSLHYNREDAVEVLHRRKLAAEEYGLESWSAHYLRCSEDKKPHALEIMNQINNRIEAAKKDHYIWLECDDIIEMEVT